MTCSYNQLVLLKASNRCAALLLFGILIIRTYRPGYHSNDIKSSTIQNDKTFIHAMQHMNDHQIYCAVAERPLLSVYVQRAARKPATKQRRSMSGGAVAQPNANFSHANHIDSEPPEFAKFDV